MSFRNNFLTSVNLEIMLHTIDTDVKNYYKIYIVLIFINSLDLVVNTMFIHYAVSLKNSYAYLIYLSLSFIELC